MKLAAVVLCALSTVGPALGYRILCIFPTPSRSHNFLAKGVVDSLLEAGHEVTWATPFPNETPRKNLKYIDVSATLELSKIDMMKPEYANAGFGFMKELVYNIFNLTVASEGLRTALVKDQFDAVATEKFFTDIDSGFAALLQVPWILLNGMSLPADVEAAVDELRSLSTVPMSMNPAPVPMSLWDRLVNVASYTIAALDKWIDHSTTVALYESTYGPLAAARGVPLTPYDDAKNNISVVLVNSHPSYDTARVVPPNVVNIAGYHIEENVTSLPEDLQALLDSSKCVVYFSMGSVIKSKALPTHTREQLLNAFSKVPCTVLWKFETELLGAPANVHARPWFPQASILAHPNIKVFITHGGLLSTLEAIHRGVALLAVPVFGDQPGNAQRSVYSGFARMVPFSYDMVQQLEVELHEMLKDDSYSKNAKRISKLFRNRPVSPKKLISHYFEMAIESKGAYHLRSPSLRYAWYERWLLDILSIILLSLLVVYTILAAIIRKIKNKICCNSNKKKKLKKQ